MSEINAGSVSVFVVPDLRKFKPEVEAKTKNMKVEIGVEADTDGLREDIEKSTKTTPAKVKVAADTDALAASIKAEALKIAKTSTVDLPLTADGERLRRDITAQAELVSRLTQVEIPVDLEDAAKLRAKMAVELDLLKVMAAQAHPTVTVDADTGGAEAKIAAIGSSSRVASGGVGALTTAILALGPALVPITGALVGAGGAFGASALAGGVGGGALGASLIGNIKNVLGAQKDLAKAKQAAATASEGQVAANRAVQSSEQQLVVAQGSRKIAQMSLTQAQDAARVSLRALSDQIKGAALAEGDASIAVRQARKNLDDTMRNSKATQLDRDAARQSYKDALFQLDQVKKRRKEISDNAAKERKAGVNGNAQVISARQGVASAENSVKSAQQSVAVAQQNAKKATTAYQVAQKSLAKTQASLSGPAAAGFVKSLGRAKTAWGDYLKVTAGPSFKVANKGLGLFSALLPNVGQLSNIAAGAVGGLLTDLKRFGQSDAAKSFLDFFKAFEGPAITQFGHIMGNLALGFGGLLKAFAPLGLKLGGGIEGLSRKFANFGLNAGSNSGFQKFLAYVQQVGPKVAQTFGDLVGAAVKIAQFLAPLGEAALGVVDGLAKFIKTADPGTLKGVALAIGGVALAFGKGPLGLAFAIGATLTHSKGFMTFLSKAGTLAGQLADSFNKLPDGIKTAALAAVGVGAIASKLKGLGGNGGLGGAVLGKFTKGGVQKVFVTNPGFGAGGGVPPVVPTGSPKPTVGPKALPPFLRLAPYFVGAAGVNAETRDPFHPRGAPKIPFTNTKIPGGNEGGAAKRIPDSQLNMAQLKSLYGDVLKNGTGDGVKADVARLRELAGLMDGLKSKSFEFAKGFDATSVKTQHLNNEVKLIGSNARGSRAEVQRLLAALDQARSDSTLLTQGLSGARVGKVDRQLGAQEITGTLSLDKDGVATLHGIGRHAVAEGSKHRETVNHHRAMGSESFR